jgi:hypothetical protein
MKDYLNAINYYQQSLVILRELEYSLGEEAVLKNLETAYKAIGNSSLKLPNYLAVWLMEKLIKKPYKMLRLLFKNGLKQPNH